MSTVADPLPSDPVHGRVRLPGALGLLQVRFRAARGCRFPARAADSISPRAYDPSVYLMSSGEFKMVTGTMRGVSYSYKVRVCWAQRQPYDLESMFGLCVLGMRSLLFTDNNSIPGRSLTTPRTSGTRRSTCSSPTSGPARCAHARRIASLTPAPPSLRPRRSPHPHPRVHSTDPGPPPPPCVPSASL